MMPAMRTTLSLILLLPSVCLAEPSTFEKDILGIFKSHCQSCHGPDKQRGGFRLDRKADALAGGDNGKAIIPGKPQDSALIHRVTTSDSKERMPPKGAPLTLEQVSTLKKWIASGAVWPDNVGSVAVEKPHWSFQPLHKTPVLKAVSANPIDSFIVARLVKQGLGLSPEADKRTLIRRLSFDLLGLPPSPEQIDEFLRDQSPDAYQKLVDRLLALPAFGERQARHWLDVVRFAESNGFETNQPRPNAYHYRDYVIKSFNDDKPYDRFVREQIVGDQMGIDAATGFLVAGPWDEVKSPDPILTAQQRADELHDMISTTGSAFLGLTVGCARCHNHKFDPISQTDYHALKAILAGVQHGERMLRTPEAKTSEANGKKLLPPVNARHNVEQFEATPAKFLRFTIKRSGGSEPCLDELEAFTAGNQSKNVALAANGGKATSSGNLPGYPIHQLAHVNDGKYGNNWSWISSQTDQGWVMIEFAAIHTIDRVEWSRDRSEAMQFRDRVATDYTVELSVDGKTWKTVASGANRVMATAAGPRVYAGRMESSPVVYRLNRGEVNQPKEKVDPGVLTSFGPAKPISPNAPESERRQALADWIANPANPLTARVIVNRIWQHHFGSGIVDTPSDFGKNGATPTHPELLDFLATELIEHNWSLKHIHRLIVTSATYRQQSKATPAGMAVDAQSRLLWRYPPQRLEAEIIRDSILSVSGKLDTTMGGPGFDLFQPNTNYVKVYTPKNEFGADTYRRMVYQMKPRMQLDDTFGAFDCPDAGQIAPKRSSSTTPLQALNLLNSPFLLQQSEFFAVRLNRETGDNRTKQIDRAFQLTFGRSPTTEETQAAEKLIAQHGLNSFCRAMLNANEFVFVR